MDPSPTTEGILLLPEPPRDSQTEGVFGSLGDTKGRDCKGSPRRVCGLTKECPVLDASRAIGSMSSGQSHLQGGSGVSQNWGPTRISGETCPESWHQNVRKYRLQNDHVKRSDLAQEIPYCQVEKGESRES
jgi:hypothetical protein